MPVTCWTRQLIHTGDDSTSSNNPERCKSENSRAEKVEGIIPLPMELLGTYDIYLLCPHDEYINHSGNHSLSCAMLDNKKQML